MLNVISGLLAGGVAASTTSYESIATTVVGSGGAASVTFSSIPSTYKHLQLRILARSSYAGPATDEVYAQFNSDTGTNYTYHNLYGNGSAAGSSAATGQVRSRISQLALTNNQTFSVAVVDILDYQNISKNKTTRSLSGADFNGSGVVTLQSTAWLNTSAINSIYIYGALDFAQYSSFALYGIRG